jgi:hypothetical protein
MSGILPPSAPGTLWKNDPTSKRGQYSKTGEAIDPEMRVLNNRGLRVPTTARTIPQRMPPPGQSHRPPSEERRRSPQEPSMYAQSSGPRPPAEDMYQAPPRRQQPQCDYSRESRSGGERYRGDRPREDRSKGDRHRGDPPRSEHPPQNPFPRGTVNCESDRFTAPPSSAPRRSSYFGRPAPSRPVEREPTRGTFADGFLSWVGRSAGVPPAQPQYGPRGERRGGDGSSRAGRERGRSPPARSSRRR